MTPRSSTRSWLLLVGAAVTSTVLGVTGTTADRPRSVAPLAPVAAVEASGAAHPSVSGDGRWVVYAGTPASADDLRGSTVWLKDREGGGVTELSLIVDGVRVGNTVMPTISSDGCTVAVITEMAFDLFRDDDEGARWDVYRLVLPHCGGEAGDWELVSASRGAGFDAAAGDDASPLYPPAVSGVGSVVAYTRQFSVADPELLGITVVDLSIPIGEPGRFVSVAGTPSTLPSTTFRYHGLRQPVISDDGLLVAFVSDAASAESPADWGSGLTPGGFATSHVYVWNRANFDVNTAVRLVSAAASGDSGHSDSPAISGDGRFIAFVSRATNLVPGATLPTCNPDCLPQVYLFDGNDGSVRLASREAGDPASPPVGADTGATQPSLDHAGNELLFISRATNLFPTRSNGLGGPSDGDVILAVPAKGSLRRISVLADGITPAPAANANPKLSATGRVVVFDTLAGAAFGNPVQQGRQVVAVQQDPYLQLADLDVGTVAVGYPGPEWYLAVANNGPSAFLPALVESSNPDFMITGGTCVDETNTPVPVGGSCTVFIMLLPSRPGELTGTLTVSEEGFGAKSISSTLTGNGGDPALAPSPAGAEAAPLLVGARGEPMEFELYNVAFNVVQMGRVRIEGANPGDFAVVSDECSGRSIAAAKSCSLQVVFTPTGAGRRMASVVAATTTGAYTTMLVSGDAHYEPKLAVLDTVVVAPTRMTVIGSGFAPNASVTLSWADGAGRPTVVTTDANGWLLHNVIVRANDRAGARTMVAQTTDGQVATTDVQVIQGSRGRRPGVGGRP